MTATTSVQPPAGALTAPGRSSSEVRRRIGERPWTPYLFIAPHFIVFAVFILYPFVLGIWISLHDSTSLRDGPFVGFAQYLKVLDPSSIHFPRFWNTVWNTILFVFMSVPLLVGVGLGLASLLNQRLRGRNVFRAIYFVPWTLSVGGGCSTATPGSSRCCSSRPSASARTGWPPTRGHG